jgi:hypothetical protein
MSHGDCAICRKHDYLRPLHDDKGGPLCCIMCAGKWHGEHGRRRRLGRIVIRAMSAYLKGGGTPTDIDKLKMTAMGIDYGLLFTLSGGTLDPLGYMADTASNDGETIELTSELLADAIKIAHPDLHPPERRDLAHRVTQGLVALQPFTFPAEKPKPPAPLSAPTETRSAPSSGPEPKPYPCKECAADVPYYYCADCRTEFESRQQKERERESAKRREQYARRKQRREARMPPRLCECGLNIKSKRKGARFCSDKCRQKAHRRIVTDKRSRATSNQAGVTKKENEREERKPLTR